MYTTIKQTDRTTENRKKPSRHKVNNNLDE